MVYTGQQANKMSNYHIRPDGLIGHIIDSTNMVQEFVGTDKEELWAQNKLKVASQFTDHTKFLDVQHYLKTPVTYRYNEHGHRNNDTIQDINLLTKPYILVIGDSFTEGTGLAVEETYAQQLKEITGLDVYNLGLGGTGIDVMLHNLVIWSTIAVNPPAMVVCQWSDINRSMEMYSATANPNTLSKHQQLVGSNHLSEPIPMKKYWIEHFLHAGNELNFYNSRAVIAEIQIKKLYQKSKIVNVVLPGWQVNEQIITTWTLNNKIWWTPTPDKQWLTARYKLDYARDLQHKGRVANSWLAQEIVKYF